MEYSLIIWTTQDNRNWGIDDFYASYSDLNLARTTAEGLLLDGDAVCAEIHDENDNVLFLFEFDEDGQVNCINLEENPEGDNEDEDDDDEGASHLHSEVLSDEEFFNVEFGCEDDNEHPIVSKACRLLAEAYKARGNSNIESAMRDLEEILAPEPVSKYAKKQLRKAFKETFIE